MAYATYWDQRTMSAEPEFSAWWIAAAGAVGSVFSFFFGAWRQAEKKGEAVGTMLEWRRSMEQQGLAAETRLLLRISALEARKDRIETRLEDVASRKEMQAGFDRLADQFTALSTFVRHGAG